MSAIKVNGTWQRVSSIKIKKDGVWSAHTALYAKSEGAWHLIDLSAEPQDPAYHVWKAYADDNEGSGISLEPTGKSYIGFATGRRNEEPDLSDPAVFDWSLIKGEDGQDVDSEVLEDILSTQENYRPLLDAVDEHLANADSAFDDAAQANAAAVAAADSANELLQNTSSARDEALSAAESAQEQAGLADAARGSAVQAYETAGGYAAAALVSKNTATDEAGRAKASATAAATSATDADGSAQAALSAKTAAETEAAAAVSAKTDAEGSAQAALSAKNESLDAAGNAQTSAEAAAVAETKADGSAQAALAAQTKAETEAAAAVQAKTDASGSASAALTAKSEAQGHASDAEGSATQAGTSALAAAQAATDAEGNALASLTAKSESLNAKDDAESAATEASTSAESAVTAAAKADGSASAALTAKSEAVEAKGDAEDAAGNASTSATAAAQAATGADGSASAALSAKTVAEQAAEDAEGSAQASSTSAQAAASAATGADGSASAALAAKTVTVTAKDDAVSAKGAAEDAAENAESAKAEASLSATAAATAATNADGSAQAALIAKTDAIDAADAAAVSAEAAVTAQTDAEGNASAALTAQSVSVSARDTAVSAKDGAGKAKAGADSAKTAAVNAKNAANTAKGKAQTAASAAEASAVKAETEASAAVTANTTAEGHATAALSAESKTSTYRDEALTAKDDAVTAKSGADSAKTAAVKAKNAANVAKGEAQTAAENAEASAVKAETEASAAVTAKTTAEGYASAALTSESKTGKYRDEAEAAKEDAETAKTGADSAKSAAVNAKNAANTAKTGAVNAKNAALAAKKAAELEAAAAVTAETNAEGHASVALDAKSDARTYMTNAEGHAVVARDKSNAAIGAATRAGESAEILSNVNLSRSNLVTRGLFDSSLSRGGWTSGSVVKTESAGIPQLSGRPYVLKLTARDCNDYDAQFPVSYGDKVYISAWVYTTDTNVSFNLGFRRALNGVPQSSWPFALQISDRSGEWVRVEGTYTHTSTEYNGLIPFLQLGGRGTMPPAYISDISYSRNSHGTGLADVYDSSRAYVDEQTGELKAERVIKANANGKVSGVHLLANGSGAEAGGKLYFQADEIAIVPPNWNGSSELDKSKFPFYFSEDRNSMYLDEATIKKLSAEIIDSGRLVVDGLSLMTKDLSLPAGAITGDMLDASFKDGLVRVNPNATTLGGTVSKEVRGVAYGTSLKLPALKSGGNIHTINARIVAPNDNDRISGHINISLFVNGKALKFNDGSVVKKVEIDIEKKLVGGPSQYYVYVSSVNFSERLETPPRTSGADYVYEMRVVGVNVNDPSYAAQYSLSFSASEPVKSSGGFITDVNWDEVKGKPSLALASQVLTNVPRGAKFTDTNTWRGVSSSVSSTSTSVSASSKAVKTAYDRGTHALNTAKGKLGAGSKAVDSDKLDGLHASSFARMSHDHNRLIAVDRRDVKPDTSGLHKVKGMGVFFTSREGLTGARGTDYQDLLVLDTYADSSGGRPNALAFDKSSHRILHYVAPAYGGGTWGTAKTIAYVEDTLGKTAKAVDSDKLDGLHASSFARTSGTYSGLRAQATTKADVGLGSVPNWSSGTFDGRYLGKSAKAADADKLDGLHASSFSRSTHGHTGLAAGQWGGIKSQTTHGYIDFGPANDGHAHIYTDRADFYFNKELSVKGGRVWHRGNDGSLRSLNKTAAKKFTVGGDAGTYYPVLITSVATYMFGHYSIHRRYNAPAPSTWNTSTHKGGLTFDFYWSGDGAWGGNAKDLRVLTLNETYSTMVGGMSLSTSGLIVWLRGGGAEYTFTGASGLSVSISPTLSTFTASDGSTFSPLSSPSRTESDVLGRMPIRRDNSLNARNGLVSAGHEVINGSDTWYRTQGSDGLSFSSYGGGLYMKDSTWVRTYGGKALLVESTNSYSIRTNGGVLASKGLRRDNKGSRWIGQRDSRYVGIYNGASVRNNLYAAVIRQRHTDYTWTVGGLGNQYFGIFAYTNGRTTNGTDGHFRMDVLGNCTASGTMKAKATNGTVSRVITYDDFLPSTPPAGLENTITANWIGAGAINARHLQVNSLVNNGGTYTSFKVAPDASRPLSLSRTDSSGKEVSPIFYVDTKGNGFFDGKLSRDTVDIESIQDEARKQINPYYLGTVAGGSQSAPATWVNSGGTYVLPAISVLGGKVNLSWTVRGGTSYRDGSTKKGYSAPTWRVEIFRGTSTSSTRIVNRTHTGSAYEYRDNEYGSPSNGMWEGSASVHINDQFSDNSAGSGQRYTIRVTRLSGTSSSINVASFVGKSPAFKQIQMKYEYTSLFYNAAGLNKGDITLADDYDKFEFLVVAGSEDNDDVLGLTVLPTYAIAADVNAFDNKQFMLSNPMYGRYWRVSLAGKRRLVDRGESSLIRRIWGVNIVEKI